MIASCPLADKPLRPPRLRVAPSGPAARSSRAAPPPHSTSQVHKHAPRVGDLWEAVWASFVAMAHESLRFCACTKPAPPNASRDGMRLRAVPRACPYRLKCGSAGARCAHDAGREGGREGEPRADRAQARQSQLQASRILALTAELQVPFPPVHSPTCTIRAAIPPFFP